jgi:hypothetical protein
VLEALDRGHRFYAFRDAPVLATGGNTGGYAVVKVFGANFPALIASVFGRKTALFRAIVGPTVSRYLPQLIWNVRTGQGGRFTRDLPLEEMRQEIGGFPVFWSVLLPVARAPLPIARSVLLASRAVSKLGRLVRG